jgi:hypothetical protein
MNPRSRHPDHQAIEARLAARLSAGLTEQAQQLPHDIGERLRAAREQALARAIEVRRLAPRPQAAGETGIVGVTAGGMALMGGTPPWWQRAASVVPLLVLVFGLLLIERQGELEQVRAAAEVDALLLADDLPPDAYTDPGFAQFLREPAP